MTHYVDKAYDILLVEDDKDIRYYLGLFLKHEGYRCLDAENGQMALKALADLPVEDLPRIAFVDIMMPVLDGPGFVDSLNALGMAPELKVFFVSASLAQPEISLHGRRCGFIQKPFDTDKILEIARNHLCYPSRTIPATATSSSGISHRP